jgi:tripartite-type tricarboxylate transporter receptor subunit TctC
LQAGLDLEHVPYQGAAPLVHALVAGQVTSAFVDLASSRTQLESLRPLAVTGPARNPVLSNVPTFKELGYKDFEYYGWYGFFLPGATPAAIVSKFNDEINRALHMPDIIQKIEGLGLMVDGGTAEAFAQTVKTEDAMYARIIKEANVKIGQ